MSNLSTHVQPKARPMTKEDKEHWRSKVKRLISKNDNYFKFSHYINPSFIIINLIKKNAIMIMPIQKSI